MTKLLSMIIAATFAAVSVSAIAASHAGAQGDKMGKGDKMDKKPSAEDCKKDPKMKGCEPAKK